MLESNGSQGPSHAPSGPDFNAEFRQAQETGDYDFVLRTAHQSHKMLLDLRDAVKAAMYPGRSAQAIAMGLNFIENMIGQAAGQLSALRQAEKQTRDALKSGNKASNLEVVGPEKPDEPPAEAPQEPAPEQPAAPVEVPQEPASA